MAAAQRIDWQAIKARWNSETAEFHLAILPKGAAQLFLAICDRLQWEATYRVENYDYSDWDELQRIVDLGIAGLTDTMRLSDLIAHVDDVETLLQAILNRPCCGSGATDTIPNPAEGGGGIAPVGTDDQVPDFTDDTDIITTPPQTSFTDADEDAETTGPEMVEYLCAAAHWYYDLLHRWLSFMKLYSTLGGLVWEPVSAIINLVVSRYGGSNPIATIAVEAADQLVNLWPEVNTAMVDAIIAELEANREDIICALAYERNLAGMISAVYSQLQTITMALGYLNMLPMVSYPVFAMALVSQGLIDLSDVEGSCAGCYEPPPTWTFDTDAEGWTRRLNSDYSPTTGNIYNPGGNPGGSLYTPWNETAQAMGSPAFAWAGGDMLVTFDLGTFGAANHAIGVRAHNAANRSQHVDGSHPHVSGGSWHEGKTVLLQNVTYASVELLFDRNDINIDNITISQA